MAERGPRFLLLQVRKPNDPMRGQEVECFQRALALSPCRIDVHDLVGEPLTASQVSQTDMFLLGGSGDYSVVTGGPWLERAMDSLRLVHASGRPAFASCWGFQAMARALGGRVIHDASRAEVGTFEIALTEAGVEDPFFGALPGRFLAQMGHEDHVVGLPENSTWLASSEMTPFQAYRFDDAPIYCTQFHPELEREDLATRLRFYPRYFEYVMGVSVEVFLETVYETPHPVHVIRRFARAVLDLPD